MASFERDDWKEQYKKGDRKNKTRLIGIEFEGELIPIADIPEEFQFFSEAAYNDVERSKSRIKLVEDELNKRGYEYGGIGYDGGGREIVTLPDSYSFFKTGGSDRFKKLFELIEHTLVADESSGTHIHISKLETDDDKTFDNIWWFMMCFHSQITKIFGRITHWAETPLPLKYYTASNNYNDILFEMPQDLPTPRKSGNKRDCIVDRCNRYEFRGPKASRNIYEILGWVQLCVNIVDLCSKGYIQNIPFGMVIQGKYAKNLIKEINKTPSRKITPKELNQTIASTQIVTINKSNKVLK